MPKFRKKPVIIEAFELPEIFNIEARLDFDDWVVKQGGEGLLRYVGSDVQIATLEGVMTGNPGDFIIKGVKGEFYPCKPDIFWTSYQSMDDVVEEDIDAYLGKFGLER